MVNKDLKNESIIEKYQEDSNEPNIVIDYLKKSWDIAHKWGFWFMLAMALGIWIGISVSKTFYLNKMEECVQIQGMVHKGKVYTILPK